MEEIKNIRISELKDFKNYPFHMQQDMELCALMKSIEDEGVIVPLLVRPNPDGEGYEVIAGHRRKAAAQWAGLAEITAVIRELDKKIYKVSFKLSEEDKRLLEEGAKKAGMNISELSTSRRPTKCSAVFRPTVKHIYRYIPFRGWKEQPLISLLLRILSHLTAL